MEKAGRTFFRQPESGKTRPQTPSSSKSAQRETAFLTGIVVYSTSEAFAKFAFLTGIVIYSTSEAFVKCVFLPFMSLTTPLPSQLFEMILSIMAHIMLFSAVS